LESQQEQPIKIWQSDIDRKYIADFDVYGEKALDSQNAEVDIYVM